MAIKEKFLMFITVIIVVAIIVNGIANKDQNLIQNLFTVLAYWMPSPMAPNSKTTYIEQEKSNNDSGI